MQVCTALQTDNLASTPPLSFLQAGCPSCRPTNSVKALKANPSRPSTGKNLGLKTVLSFYNVSMVSKNRFKVLLKMSFCMKTDHESTTEKQMVYLQ